MRIVPSIVTLTLQGNIAVMAVSGLLTGSYTGMLNTILQPFTLSAGLSLAMLGILQSLGNRTGGLAGSIVQPVGGYLSELFGRRAVVRAGSALAIIAMSFFLLAAITHISLILVPAYLLYGSSLLSLPASQVLIAESVGLDYGRMKIAYSIVFLFSNIPAAFTSFFGGIIADSLGYYVIFASAVSLEAVNFVLYSTRLKETNRPTELSSRRIRGEDVVHGSVVDAIEEILGLRNHMQCQSCLPRRLRAEDLDDAAIELDHQGAQDQLIHARYYAGLGRPSRSPWHRSLNGGAASDRRRRHRPRRRTRPPGTASMRERHQGRANPAAAGRGGASPLRAVGGRAMPASVSSPCSRIRA